MPIQCSTDETRLPGEMISRLAGPPFLRTTLVGMPPPFVPMSAKLGYPVTEHGTFAIFVSTSCTYRWPAPASGLRNEAWSCTVRQGWAGDLLPVLDMVPPAQPIRARSPIDNAQRTAVNMRSRLHLEAKF